MEDKKNDLGFIFCDLCVLLHISEMSKKILFALVIFGSYYDHLPPSPWDQTSSGAFWEQIVFKPQQPPFLHSDFSSLMSCGCVHVQVNLLCTHTCLGLW